MNEITDCLEPATQRPATGGLRQRALQLINEFDEHARLGHLTAQTAGVARTWRARLRHWQGDLFGGTVAALIAVPYGMALALAIGLPPEAGLYTSIIGGLISGLLSNSPVLISGLSATAVPILAVVVKTHGLGAALFVGCLSGVIMTLIGALKLGRFANYLPQSIVSAFTTGLGLTIVASQLRALLDVQPAKLGFDLGVVDDLIGALAASPHTDWPALAIGGCVLAAMIWLPKLNENLPSSIIGVLLATGLAWLFGLQIPRVGALPSGLPAPRLLEFHWSAFSQLLHPALTLAGLFTINQVLTAVVVNRASQRHNREKANRELIAQGAANIVLPFFGAPPGVAMLARTVASTRIGAMTRLSVLAHSFVLLLFLLPLRGLISQIPLSALAAVTVMVGFQLIDWRRFLALRRMARADAALFLLTFLLVVLSDLVTGVGIGFLIAMALFIERAAESTHLEAVATAANDGAASTAAAIQAFRIVGPLFFATSERLLGQLRSEATAEVLVLDLAAAGPADSAAVELLRKVYEMQRARSGALFVTGLNQQLYALCEQSGLIDELGSAHVKRQTTTGSLVGADSLYLQLGSLQRA